LTACNWALKLYFSANFTLLSNWFKAKLRPVFRKKTKQKQNQKKKETNKQTKKRKQKSAFCLALSHSVDKFDCKLFKTSNNGTNNRALLYIFLMTAKRAKITTAV